ncbi:D-2-hydroxyacid dehydrogenase family protein [Hymenobacter sp. CRA2]|uniref:D-2-hydroxyacid dehydrogenase family protein n=1 Tax=Hymenobacter sp. CRA2 TaxID=1955620 RepID=UPI00098F32D8|nr:D-2-hydroxyacid dehydrogenase family protein [Hymenobacter sp. CRA2]OON68466.1 3-phosphoglycerate dehydrogenase [Hymenobacter sp. CRA2]
MHIIIPDDYQHVIQTLDCFRLLDGHRVSIYHDAATDLDTLASRFQEADALVLTRERTSITAELLARLPKLRLISQTGKISSHLDLEACTARGVAVAEGVGSPVAPAELAWALMLNARRELPAAIAAMKQGRWQVNMGRALQGQTLGIWGYGKIGRRVAHYAQAFEVPVLVWGSEASRRAAVADGHQAASNREAFFAEADIVSLHLRLTDATRHLIGPADLARMKPDALLVNISRAELLQPGALEATLRRGRPGFAAVDVYEQEPIFDPNHPLLQLPNVLCTPHLGYVERSSYELYFGKAFENVVAFAAGRPQGIANPQVLPSA